MRDIWQITDLPTHGGQIRLASYPQKLTVGAIKNIVYRALRSQQIIKKLDKTNGEGNRHEFKMIHGFRKAFKTICENSSMKSINIEILLGHNIGVSSSYYKPKQQELLSDYLQVVDDLTINDQFRLIKQVKELKQQDDYHKYIIDKKMQEKDDIIKTMKKTYDTELKILKETVLDMQELMKYPKKLSEL